MIDKNLVLPKGYGIGISRDDRGEKTVAHLYKLDDGTFGKPMCEKGYTHGIYGYSIFRGHTSPKGICKTCMKRALEGLEGVDFKLKSFDNFSQEDQKLIYNAMQSTALNKYQKEDYLKEDNVSEDIVNMVNRELKEAERLMYLVNVLAGHKEYIK